VDDMLRKKVHMNDSMEMISSSSQNRNTGMVRDIVKKRMFLNLKDLAKKD